MIDFTNADDLGLVSAIASTPEQSLAELRRRHGKSIEASVRMILGNRAECADVVAEVFTKLWQRPELFDASRGTLLSFLRVQGRHRAFDLLRSESRRASREVRSQPANNFDLSSETESLFIASDDTANLRMLLARLPEAERAVIDLAYFGEMSYRDVAIHLSQPEGTVKGRIRSGLKRLREQAAMVANEVELATRNAVVATRDMASTA